MTPKTRLEKQLDSQCRMYAEMLEKVKEEKLKYKKALEYIAEIPGTSTPENLENVNGINDGRDRGIRLCGAVNVARAALKDD